MIAALDTTPLQPDIVRWVGLFVLPGTTTELRAFFPGRGPRVRAYPANELGKLAEHALACEREEASGIYFVPNPIRPGITHACKDEDIVSRRWLLIDIDPVREANTNSTEAERLAAWKVLCIVRQVLGQAGITQPIIADSANGWHLCYPIDMPNDEAAKTTVRDFLINLGEKYNTENAKIDSVVFNAARIWKCYGTIARKGASAPDRPHRRSQLIDGKPWEAAIAATNTERIRDLVTRWQGERKLRQQAEQAKVDHYVETALQRELAAVRTAAPGTRNNTLNTAAFSLGTLVQSGQITADRAERELVAAALVCGLPEPEATSTVRRAIRDAQTASPRKPIGEYQSATVTATTAVRTDAEIAEWEQETPIPLDEGPKVDPFPIDCLPKSLQGFAAEAAWSFPCPVDFIAVPMLAVAGGCLGNTIRLSLTRSHTQSACVFASVVGDPGSYKSPALEMVVKPLDDVQSEWRREFEQQKAAQSENDPPPVFRRIVADRTTLEALLNTLAENPRGIIQVRDELAGLVAGMNQYRDKGQGDDRQTYLQLWSHKSILIDRVLRRGVPQSISKPFLALVGTIQPDTVGQLRQSGGKAVNDGFLDRFLFAWPDSFPAEEEKWREVSSGAAAAWDSAVRRLLNFGLEKDEHDRPRPRLIYLSSTGRSRWEAFTRAHAQEINADDFPEALKAPWSKLRGYCARLALILHLLDEAAGGDVTGHVEGSTIDRAAKLTSYFKSHARRVWACADRDGRGHSARLVLDWLRTHKHETFRQSTVYRHLRRRFDRPEDVELPLTYLERHGWIRRIDATQPGRRSTPLYQSHPHVRGAGNVPPKPERNP